MTQQPERGERASFNDFRVICLLIGYQHCTSEDLGKELPLERVRYWLPLVNKVHIPQQALYENLQGRLHYFKDCNGKGWRDLIGSLLNKRALVALALYWASDHDEPVRWE